MISAAAQPAWNSFGLTGINDSGAIVGTATYTQQSTNDPTAAGSHGVLLVPFVVSQTNYPVASTADPTTDSGATTTNQTIVGEGANNGIALITGTPTMPQLTVKINGLDSTDKVYNEFNAGGSQAELPNFSGTSESEPQDGWGIFQRDDTDGGIYVDTDQVYSWTVNTFVAMTECESKQAVQQRFFNAVKGPFSLPQSSTANPQ